MRMPSRLTDFSLIERSLRCHRSALDESNRMGGIKSLGLESIPGSIPTFYSPHARARAKYLQGLLGGEIA